VFILRLAAWSLQLAACSWPVDLEAFEKSLAAGNIGAREAPMVF